MAATDGKKGLNESKSANPLTKYSNYSNYKLRELTVVGYVRAINLDIPTDIVGIIINYYPTFKWSNKLSHKHQVIKDDIVENSNPKRAWICAYDSEEYDKGIMKWTVKLLHQKSDDRYTHWTIGIVNSSKVKNDGFFPNFGGTTGFGYVSNGRLYYGRGYSYATEYGVGDIITTIVNFDTLSISFALNGKDLGEFKEKLKKETKYRFAVSTYCIGDKLTYLRSWD